MQLSFQEQFPCSRQRDGALRAPSFSRGVVYRNPQKNGLTLPLERGSL
ncbi:hypothetical protein SYN63AY4M2_13120 [Synechococcus sp. 63AY4M2]|nr:hypothetical protein SYN63AY4M2_13120 [Synechococcus sp. 63AY4M2]PIK96328.1 hypothetical protein SYN60AY4M2_00150 [Synechococcus sp. 60AY4M2]PIK99165.1 hypothetical protein SYN63AY4M1_11080 [Synechococcus sp. 63AY4M1]PIL02386.1 hypothetical protein SYN65AY640_02945 [Synechococcus sp. 65AY640]